MTTFAVNPSSLNAVADTLDNLQSEVAHLDLQPDGFGDEFGGPNVAVALSDLCQTMGKEFALWADSMGAITGSLRRGAALYMAGDAQIAGDCAAERQA